MKLKNKNAFTLIEVLVVISVISLLMAVLVPALAGARQQSRQVVCLNNLKQLYLAAVLYSDSNNDYYPIAYYTQDSPLGQINFCWDFTVIEQNGTTVVEPGLLWSDAAAEQIQQCPEFKGDSNTPYDPYTGYNYNTSYIGHGQYENIVEPVKIGQVTRPQGCVIFGDGQWAGGANKFMRAPLPNPADRTFNGRYAGTQSFRHSKKTNVAWCDGHASSIKTIHTNIEPDDHTEMIAPGTGFLSFDNSAYDLK